ncbi:unnamed protein product [Cutaneotrichosporon oleaginosum]
MPSCPLRPSAVPHSRNATIRAPALASRTRRHLLRVLRLPLPATLSQAVALIPMPPTVQATEETTPALAPLESPVEAEVDEPVPQRPHRRMSHSEMAQDRREAALRLAQQNRTTEEDEDDF